MTLPEKVAVALAVAVIALIGVIIGGFWWARRAPSRPAGVAANAVFIWAPHLGLPAPRRGWWLVCWESFARNRCKLSDIDGNTEYEGEFIPYGSRGPLPADQLKIDTDETRKHKVWVGDALVPLVYLKNGRILIPASKYEEGTHLLEQLQLSR